MPKAASIWVLMRSKWPSTLAVCDHSVMPPASFTGPVCTASMPMDWKISHSCGSPSAPRYDSPSFVMSEIG